MATIQFTGSGSAARAGVPGRELARAAVTAQAAPSLFNTQPWRWRIDGDMAFLRADRARQVPAVDPDGRLLVLSCGVALHHARTVLAAAGVAVEIAHLADPDDPDLLAAIHHVGPTAVTPAALRLRRALATRRTDRRPFADRPVPAGALERVRTAAEEAGAHLHLVPPSAVVGLTVAAGHTAAVERADPAYLSALAHWVHSGPGRSDGVPVADTVPATARPVPIRDFTATGPDPTTVHDMLPLADRYARYGILFTDGDHPRDWLIAGEALSAVLLTATAEGLATSPMSDPVEVPFSRELVRDLLGGVGYPAVAVRIGMPGPYPPRGPVPRRSAAEVVAVP